MSVCAPCIRLKEISKCTDSIVIGIVPIAETEYQVFFKNTATGKVVRYEGTSDVDSLLTITPPYGFNFSNETDYEVWVIETGNGINDNIDFQPEGYTVYMDDILCVLVSFLMVWDGDLATGENINFTTQTFELA